MITSNIIARFNLQVDDSSELSSDEELALANEVYIDICNDRDWEWLKTTATGTTSISVPYIALPSAFKKLSTNSYNESVVFVGTDYQEYKVIPFSSRRDYRDQDGFCYLDMVNRRLYFTKQPTTAKAIEYDYITEPTALTLSTTPILTTDQFGTLIAYGMAAKFNPIEQTDKAVSYRTENTIEYQKILSDYRIEDSNIKLSI
jgi:hypothetical protein